MHLHCIWCSSYLRISAPSTCTTAAFFTALSLSKQTHINPSNPLPARRQGWTTSLPNFHCLMYPSSPAQKDLRGPKWFWKNTFHTFSHIFTHYTHHTFVHFSNPWLHVATFHNLRSKRVLDLQCHGITPETETWSDSFRGLSMPMPISMPHDLIHFPNW